jgi:hypothetical protein
VTSLADKIVAISLALHAADFLHAFGGALALAFHVEEPRATRDIDLNVFVTSDRVSEVFAALPPAIDRDARAERAIAERGQVRLFWDENPVDVFFSTHTFHDVAAAHVVEVPFNGAEIPVLGGTELTVFKAFFDRTRDWADIEAMLETDAVDEHRALGWLVDLLGTADARVERFRAAIDREAPAQDPRFALSVTSCG